MSDAPTRRAFAFAFALALVVALLTALPAAASASRGTPGPSATEATHASAAQGRIFFARDRQVGAGTEYDVHAINPDGTGLINLTPGTDANELGPTVDPSGRWVAFGLGAPDFKIWLMRSDGTSAAQLMPGVDNDFFPTFSPDGGRIAFIRNTAPGIGLETDIWLVNRDGTDPVNVTNSPGLDEIWADFSPDGRRLAFEVLTAPGESDIYSIAVDGSGRAPLILGAGPDRHPAYSPDGKRIVFTRGPGDQLHLAAADGSGVINLTPTWPNEAFASSWSGDGARIVFDDDGSDLFTIAASGGAISPLTDDDQPDSNPDWEHVFSCAGRRATIVGDDGRDKIKGTKKADVIVANAGKDIIRGRGGNDRICGGRGKDGLRGNNGRDRLLGGPGADLLVGGRAADALRGGKGKDSERQ